jgi:hypothetical protein
MLNQQDVRNMAPRMLAVEYCPLVSISLDPQNPRIHGMKQVRQIADSFKTFGFNVPVLVDADLLVIAGYSRLLASQLALYSAAGALQFVCMDWLHTAELLAAAQRANTGRVCYCIELDPWHVDTIVRRWLKFTGLGAVYQVIGQPFAQGEKESPDARRG